MKRLLIVQDYVPAYRVPFFKKLRLGLESCGIELSVVAGSPRGTHELRQDAAGEDVVDKWIHCQTLSIAGKTVSYRSLREHQAKFSPHGVVIEQSIRNLEQYQLFVERSLFEGAQVAMWGQGRSFSTKQGKVASQLKNWLTRRTDWFYAYTKEGAAYLEQNGYAPSRITTLNNTFDTQELADYLEEVSEAEIAAFQREHGLVQGQTAVYLGGVDQAKGMDFLLQSTLIIRDRFPDFRLIVGGTGALAQHVVERQQAGYPISYLGRLEGRRKALAIKSADVMLIPQWVGLVAVDSLICGRPIVTTEHPSHSPEFGYLEIGRTALMSRHDVNAFATTVEELLGNRRRLSQMQFDAREAGKGHTLEGMTTRFVNGTVSWLGDE